MNVRTPSLSSESGFTLSEVIVASTFLLMVLLAVVSVHLFGLRMFELTRAKLGAGDEARKAINLLSAEIRSAKVVDVGTFVGTNFIECAMYAPQQGSALRVLPTTDPAQWICYYLRYDTTAKMSDLIRVTSTGNAPTVVARSIVTNTVVFAAENYDGSVETNNYNNRVIAVTLPFSQIQYPTMKIGGGNYYDFYQLRTRMTRRTLE